ncbi:hypothetical protein BSKO_10628 [Bryopsis sp. KO-2023]|nr:hypothetical protein BSKO_10628 [Bryopsis sp. KO-2023]
MVKEDEEMADEQEERIVNEEYKIWKKNSPYLYDLLISHALEWPSLTVEWFPGQDGHDSNISKQKLLLGTHTSDEQQNYLLIVEATLPLQDSEFDSSYYDDERKEVGGFGRAPGKIQTIQQISHDGEVNRARFMPQNSFLLATKTVHAEVYVFDYSKHPSKPLPGAKCKPDLRLQGHEAEGYGLAWSPFCDGQVISGSDDRKICLWDIKGNTHSENCLKASSVYMKHDGVVEDVAWHMRHVYLFGSVGDDKMLCIWDTRKPPGDGPVAMCRAHDAEVNCISFNPLNDWLLATGSTDRMVALHDIRQMSTRLHTLEGHTHDVFSVNWSPKDEAVLASCGADRRLLVWDLGRAGRPRVEESEGMGVEDDAPPELMFVHGGHTAKVSDFAWNHSSDWVIASVAEDNILQVWQVGEDIHTENALP